MKNAAIKRQRVVKWKSWKTLRTGLLRDYASYKYERNRLNDILRSAKRKYEQRLIDDMNENPSLYHGHCRRSLKTKQVVTNVVDRAGRLTETEEFNSIQIYFPLGISKGGNSMNNLNRHRR